MSVPPVGGRFDDSGGSGADVGGGWFEVDFMETNKRAEARKPPPYAG